MEQVSFSWFVYVIMLAMIAATRFHKSIIAMTAGVVFLTSKYIGVSDICSASLINLDFVITLIGMSIFASFIKKAGLFQFLVLKGIRKSEWNLKRLIRNVCFVILLLSGFFCDRTAVVLIFPIIAFIFDALNVEFNPALLGILNSAAIGGTLLSISGAEVMIVSAATGMDFLTYFLNITPAVLMSFFISTWVLNAVHVKSSIDTTSVSLIKFKEDMAIRDPKLFSMLILIIAFTLIMLFFSGTTGISNSVIIISGSILLFLLIDVAPDRVLSDIKLNLFFYILGLQVVAAAFVKYKIYESISVYISALFDVSGFLFAALLMAVSALTSLVFGRLTMTFFFIPVISGLKISSHDLTPLYAAFVLGISFSRAPTMLREMPKVLKDTHIEDKNVWSHYFSFIRDSLLIYAANLAWFFVYLYIRYYHN